MGRRAYIAPAFCSGDGSLSPANTEQVSRGDSYPQFFSLGTVRHSLTQSRTVAARRRLLAAGVVAGEDYDALTGANRRRRWTAPTVSRSSARFVVASRIALHRVPGGAACAGRVHGLVLGNAVNKLLFDRIGVGVNGCGVPRRAPAVADFAAVKALQPAPELNARTLARFFIEAKCDASA